MLCFENDSLCLCHGKTKRTNNKTFQSLQVFTAPPMSPREQKQLTSLADFVVVTLTATVPLILPFPSSLFYYCHQHKTQVLTAPSLCQSCQKVPIIKCFSLNRHLLLPSMSPLEWKTIDSTSKSHCCSYSILQIIITIILIFYCDHPYFVTVTIFFIIW